MRDGTVSIGPRPLFYLIIGAAIAFGAALFVYAPDPLALIDAGARPGKALAVIKWGGGLIALLGVWRVCVLKRVSAGPDGIVISSWLGSRRHDWSDLKDANLDTVEGSPPGYRLRFGAYSMFLLRREYAPAAIASLREVVKAHRG
ncbi:hypothetical protein OF829_12125 [Sphingomonas sp. LB-2]|uniref:hypothetical protein n=1 Tax=Sphingomonas caeni TaxID=2984949 RepID=UPI002232B5DD|nr:hypothetical protein [Sphingomonas caeni]MCW3847987.1 hypothetical protein [Sphingomonas caeni]